MRRAIDRRRITRRSASLVSVSREEHTQCSRGVYCFKTLFGVDFFPSCFAPFIFFSSFEHPILRFLRVVVLGFAVTLFWNI